MTKQTKVTWRTAALSGAAGIAALVALTGCAGTTAAEAGPSPTSTVNQTLPAEATATSPSSATAAPTSAGGGGPSTGGGTLRSSACTATQLQGSVTAASGGGAAGHQGYDLVFRNTGTSPCTLQGWPGVSFVGKGNGTQLGAAATLDRSSEYGTVTIADGSIAHATLVVAQPQNYGDCGATTADGFRVYPPGSKQSLFIDAGQLQLSACTSASVQQLEVQAVQPGS
ncbi:DUF4232 domain-containing protein [Curtobacterium luteum]|uniref:DUF4232 domain-containing protein n=1 Tax=Curtobacterium luteum TaxID=33881 RepID=UPI0037FD7309